MDLGLMQQHFSTRTILKLTPGRPKGGKVTTQCYTYPTLDDDGYAMMYHACEGKTKRGAKLVKELHDGPCPEDLETDHLCYNRACVRPSHLEFVTSRVNTMRGTGPSKRNADKTECKWGHTLSDARVRSGKRHCLTCIRLRRSGEHPLDKAVA